MYFVDVVFSYKDLYLNKVIYLNIDLKSYKVGLINVLKIEFVLVLLVKIIECVCYSFEWLEKYNFF